MSAASPLALAPAARRRLLDGIQALVARYGAASPVGDAEKQKWITVNGAHVPLDRDGEPKGKVGEKIRASGEAAGGRSFDDYRKAAGGDRSKAAKAFYKQEMKGKPTAAIKELGNKPVNFGGGKDEEKFHQGLNDPIKAEAIQHVRDVIETGKHHGPLSSYKKDQGLSDHYSEYHYFQKEIPMKGKDGKPMRLIADVGKTEKGEWEFIAHSFAHSDSGGYQGKIGHLRNRGLAVEDSKKGMEGSVAEGVKAPCQQKTPSTSGKNISPSRPHVNTDSFALDRATRRRIDANGFLHVALSHISKECVNPYYGREIPGCDALGLEPERIYQGYRSGAALAKGADSFNGLPILMGHHAESADNPQKEHRVGSTGTAAAFNAPYLDNALSITDADAIRAIESGRAVELSSAYRYEPVFEAGEFNGEKYDFIMTNIRGNHVALVEEGRAGPDVAVADERINPHPLRKVAMGIKELIAKLKEWIAAAENAGADPAGPGEGQRLTDDADPEKGGSPADPAAPAAKDGEAGDPEAELCALLDGINDKELAAKIRAKIAQVRGGATDAEGEAGAGALLKKLEALLQGGAAADEDPAPKEEEAAKDSDPAPEKEGEKPLTARDAALIRKQARQEAATETRVHIRGLTEAARQVRELCGELDPFAFDSAADIYRHALKASGRNVSTRDPAALRDMIGMALDAKAGAMAGPAAPAFDSGEMTGPFAGLGRITLQQ